MTTVSVVIPAYNASRWISETLGSVLAQDYPALDVIVVDDGSTDDTAAIVAQFGQVRYIRKSNGGEGSARNVGIRVAYGEYVAFVDSDDLWLPEKLRLQVELLIHTGLMWVYSDGYAFDSGTGNTLYSFSKMTCQHSGDILQQLLLEDFIPCPTPLIRRCVFDEVGYFDESKSLFMRADWDMWLRIAARYPVGLVNRPLVRYRVHSGSGSNTEPPLVAFKSRLDVIERAVTREPVRLAPLRNHAISRLCLSTGRLLAGQGNITEARSMFVEAIRHTPGKFEAYLYFCITLLGGEMVARLVELNRKRRQMYMDDSKVPDMR